MVENKELILGRFVKKIIGNFYILVTLIGVEELVQIFGKEFTLMNGQYEYKVRNLKYTDGQNIAFEYTKAGTGNAWDRMNLTEGSTWRLEKMTVEQIDLVVLHLSKNMDIGLSWLTSITAKQKDRKKDASKVILKLEDELRKIKAEGLIKRLKELKTGEAVEELMAYL